jgi:UrcA family protein
MKIVSAALAAAFLVAGSTGAFAAPRENVSFAVSTQKVNFNDPASVNKFRDGLQRQIAAACAPADDEIATGRGTDFKCRKSMTISSDTRIAQLTAKSNSMMAIVE